MSFASSDEAARAAEQLATGGVGAVNVLATPLTGPVRQMIIDRLNRATLPA